MPHQGHTARVSAELLYIVFYPLQCCDLVQKSEVANRVVAGSRPQETCNGEKVQSAVKTLNSPWHFSTAQAAVCCNDNQRHSTVIKNA
jgi:hypothetical protein